MTTDKDPSFDPYHKWLAIPKAQRPPTLYQLLGLAQGESDAEVIEEAVIRQTTHIRAYQVGPHAEVCTRILNEISKAQQILGNPEKRAEYAFSADGGRLFSGGDEAAIHVWDVAAAREIGRVASGSRGVTAMLMTNDGKLITGGSDGVLRIWTQPRETPQATTRSD
jgi:WD40 repeat protein